MGQSSIWLAVIRENCQLASGGLNHGQLAEAVHVHSCESMFVVDFGRETHTQRVVQGKKECIWVRGY